MDPEGTEGEVKSKSVWGGVRSKNGICGEGVPQKIQKYVRGSPKKKCDEGSEKIIKICRDG